MNWYYESGGQQQGPVRDEELDRLVAAGTIRPDTLVWHEGMTGWQPLQSVRATASPLPAGSDLVRCASCGQLRPASEVVQIGQRPICPVCKPAVLQALQQTGTLPLGDEDSRTGPPWERRAELGTFPAIWETIKAVLTEPERTFSRMRREGGIEAPFIYYMLTATAGLFVGYAFQGLLQSGMAGGSFPGPFGKAMTMRSGPFPGIGWLLWTLILCVASPLLAAMGAFVGAGILHVSLMICQGARRPFETTFRVYCYGHGSAMALQIVPVCGSLVAGIWALVVVCIGLARSHEITVGRAVLAVLLPVILCCTISLVFFGSMMAIAVAAAAAARH